MRTWKSEILMVIAVIAIYFGWHNSEKIVSRFTSIPSAQGIAGVDPGPTHYKLAEYSAALQAAEKKGDRGLILGLIDPVVALNQKMDNVTRENTVMWNCKLAMVHLLNGIQAGLEDMAWARQNQFDAALADCK